MDVLIVIAPAFAVILTGFAAVRFRVVPEAMADHLVRFAYFICVPSLMFSIVARHPIEGLLGGDFWLGFGGGSVVALLALRWLPGRLLGRDPRSRAISAMAAVIANTGFVSLPILYAVFGAAGEPPAAIANIVIAGLMVPLSIMLLEATGGGGGGGGGGAASPARQVVQVLRNPMVWPAILGFAFALFRLPVPDVVEGYLDLLGQGLAPCALFAIGAAIRLQDVRLEAARIVTVAALKLVALPAFVLGAGLVLGLDPFLLTAAVVCAASPTANTVYVLAVQYRSQEQTVAAAVSATTLVCVVTLPIWMVVLAGLFPEAFRPS